MQPQPNPLLFVTLIVTGIVGYSHPPPELCSSGMAPVRSIHVTYTIFGLLIFTDVLGLLIRWVFAFALIAAGIIGMFYLSKVVEFDLVRAKDVVLYLAVVYLLCKNVTVPFSKSLEYLTVIVSIAIVALSAYVMYRFKRLKVIPIIERPELFSIQFTVIALTGIYYYTSSLIAIIVAMLVSIYALKSIAEMGI